MKRNLPYAALIALVLCACAKAPTPGLNDSAKLYFDAWLHVNHPDAVASGLGAYVLSETTGSGTEAGTAKANPYVRVHYIVSELDGTVLSTSLKEVAQRIGEYDEEDYYGPEIWQRGEGQLAAGLDDALESMRTGGIRTVAIPGWLNMLEDHNHAIDYFNSKTEPGDIRLYEYEILDATRDITRWCVDSVARFVAAHPVCPYAKSAADVPSEDARFVRCGAETKDTTALGFWYQSLKNPTVEKYMPVLVNYVGRLLNGQVFDTNIKDTAKKYDPKWSSKTYSPMKIKFGKDYTDLRAISSNNTESSLIRGFTYAVRHMGPDEWGVALFHQGMGYAGTAADKIPAYCPLMFELRLVKQ